MLWRSIWPPVLVASFQGIRMCTMALFVDQSPRFPLVVAANRDESRRRPSQAPFLWQGPMPWVAGRDERSGGTWLGLNVHGLVVGLTNLWTGTPPDPRKASRGELVAGMLGAPDGDQAARWLTDQDPTRTNGFIVVWARAGEGAWWATSADDLRIHGLGAGIHAFGNQLPNDPGAGKIERASHLFHAAWAERLSDEPAAIVAALRSVLATHVAGGDPVASLCVHGPGDHGTVSATVMLLEEQLEAGRLYHAAGPPCVTPLDDFSPLLAQLASARNGATPSPPTGHAKHSGRPGP